MITVDWQNKIVNSDSSISDVVALRTTLRGLEESETGILYPPIMTYKLLDLGGGAYFPAIEFINGYQLKFPVAGNYTIKGGNIKATIIPVAGVYVNQTQSAAYAVTSVGGGGGSDPWATELPGAYTKTQAGGMIDLILKISKFLQIK